MSLKIKLYRQNKCFAREIKTELKDIRQTTEINMAPCNVAKRL